jgi:long-chain fatty acid transport protein
VTIASRQPVHSPRLPFAWTRIATALLLAGVAGTASATNGYSPTGFGTTNKGMVGAGVALPQDALAAGTNPAGMALLGHRLDVGAALFAPDRGFQANDDARPGPFPFIPPGTYDSENDVFLIPHFGWNRPLDDRSSIGLSLAGNGGMNTEYDARVWQNFGRTEPFIASAPTGVDFAQLFLGVSYARQVADNHWVGVMPIVAYQRFEAEGLEPFRQFSIDRGAVTNNGHDDSWGYGLRVGWLGRITETLSLGASYQTRLEMDEFDDYRGLFAEQGDFDTPSTWVIGLAWEATPEVTLVLDWQRINYGEVDTLANPNDVNIRSGDPNVLLGADGGLGFGWEDIDIWKLGVQWQATPRWTLRAGYSWADQLFEGGQALFNVLAPATIREHASVGATWRYADDNELSFALTRAFNERISGQNQFFTLDQTGFVEMDQWELELSWSQQF